MIAVHHEKSLVPAFLKVSVGHLYDNRESGKINNCFGKSLGSETLYEPCLHLTLFFRKMCKMW